MDTQQRAQDPYSRWDGTRWWRWDGQAWVAVADETTPAASVPVAPSTVLPVPMGQHAAAPQARNRKMLAVGIAAAVVFSVIALTAGAFLLLGGRPFTAQGTFSVIDFDTYFGESGTCEGEGGYSDIESGTQVLVKNVSGEILAYGDLGPGSASTGMCVFPFSIAGIPAGESIYTVEVGRRGSIQFDEQQMRDGVELSLGDID